MARELIPRPEFARLNTTERSEAAMTGRLANAAGAIVQVGGGRGFVVRSGHDRLVITAAHCLPHLPPCMGASGTEERTFANLIGRLGGEADTWAECLFADPMADIAVLGSPDGQELWEEAKGYERLTGKARALPIAEAPPQGSAHILSVDGQWIGCAAMHFGGPLWLEVCSSKIQRGMSGSPIVNDAGAAIGMVCLSSSSDGHGPTHGPNPRLTHHLPAGILRKLPKARSRREAVPVAAA